MAEIASLGIKIDSSDATRASKELDSLKTAGKKAEDAIKALGKSTGPGLGAIEAAAKRAGVSVEEFRARMAKASADANKQFPSMAKGADTAATAATHLGKASIAGHGAVEAAAKRAGISVDAFRARMAKASGDANKQFAPLTEGADELAHASERAEKSTSDLANIITRRFVVGIAVSQIKSLGTALAGLTAEAARAGDLGRLTGVGSQGVQGILAAAGNKGITSDAMSGALVAFNQQIPLAKAGIGDLGALLRANRVTVTDTGDAFFKVADLTKNAADDTARLSILRQAGLPATMEMARLMAQGAASIREQVAESSKLTDAQIVAARRIEDSYNKLWTSFTTTGKAAVVEVADGWIAAWERPLMDPSTLLGGWWNNLKLRSGNSAEREEAQRALRGNPLPGSSPYGQGGVGSDSRFPTRTSANTTKDAATLRTIDQTEITRAQVRIGLIAQTPTAASVAAARAAKSTPPAGKTPANDCHEYPLQQAA
ncbi:MAG: hypothetical protein K9G60_01860 [Pseudolabrys sp.]|nr:hypothetical protein [Pseudolabrys sp.]